MPKKILLLIGAIIFLSFFIFKYQLYWAIVGKTGIAIAYSLDQFFPLLFTGIVGLWFFYKKTKKNILWNLWKQHSLSIALLFLAVVIVHGLIIGFYFFGEDPTTTLIPSMEPASSTGNVLIERLKGYPLGVFIVSYLFFGTHAWLYNLVTLFIFTLAVIALYALLYILTGKKVPALLGTIFFVTTPVYLDAFTWQTTASGMSLALLVGILFLIMLILFQKTKKPIYYLFSLLFFVAMLKISFVRILGFIVVVFYLFFFPAFSKKFSFKQASLFFLPFFSVWFICLSMQYLMPIHFFEKLFTLITHPYAGVDETLHIRVRSDPLRTDNYFLAIGTLLAYLFVPTQIASYVFSSIKTLLQSLSNGLFNPSLTAITGNILIILTALLSIFSFIKRKNFVFWMILFAIFVMLANIFYIPLFIPDFHSPEGLDNIFMRNYAGNGPGSRYVFMSSLGLGILIAALTYWLLKKRGKYKSFILFGIGLIIIFQAYLSIQSRYEVVSEVKYQSTLPEQIFPMIPRDKKKKILFSTNPEVNSIERKIGGEKWLYAFYPNGELLYINKKEKLLQLIKSGEYKKENIYAFYTNPETFAFADVSQLVRNELVDRIVARPVVLQSDSTTFSSRVTQSEYDMYPFFLQRGVFISHDIQEKFLQPRQITFSLEKEYIPGVFPYLDLLPFSQKRQFPLALWRYANNAPIIDIDNELDTKLQVKTYNKQIAQISQTESQAIIAILKNREELLPQTQFAVSDIVTYDNKIRQKSLLDGVFITNPLKTSDTYFLAETTPTTITLRFPYPITVGRVLLNVPPGFPANLPVNIQIYSSTESTAIIGTMDNAIPTQWSPNKGNLYDIKLQSVLTDSLRIEIIKTTGNPITLDEIIVDDVNALIYSPEEIHEVGKLAQRYVNSWEQLDTLLSINQWNSLTAFYACAEDIDWQKQKKDMSEEIPHVWKASQTPLHYFLTNETLSFSVDCNGSVLRKIILVAPTNPGKFTVNNIVLE